MCGKPWTNPEFMCYGLQFALISSLIKAIVITQGLYLWFAYKFTLLLLVLKYRVPEVLLSWCVWHCLQRLLFHRHSNWCLKLFVASKPPEYWSLTHHCSQLKHCPSFLLSGEKNYIHPGLDIHKLSDHRCSFEQNHRLMFALGELLYNWLP